MTAEIIALRPRAAVVCPPASEFTHIEQVIVGPGALEAVRDMFGADADADMFLADLALAGFIVVPIPQFSDDDGA